MVTTPKVLIIDDSNTECLFMGQALQHAGYQVLVANNGHQGIQLLAQESPRCLLLDIVLPGMSGFEVCRYVRSQSAYQNMPIIMVSTKNSASDRFWAKRQGADYYLSKPFKAEALIEMVNGIMAEQNKAAATSQSGETSQLRPPGTQRPASASSSHPTDEYRSAETYTKTVREAANPRFEPGNPFSLRSAGGQQSAQAQPDSNRTSPQAPLGSRPAHGSPSAQGKTWGKHTLGAAFARLIPRRNEHAGFAWSHKPDTVFIADPQARELYNVIDGQRNIEVLALMTLMGKDEIARAVHILLDQQRISLYDPNGHLMDNIFE